MEYFKNYRRPTSCFCGNRLIPESFVSEVDDAQEEIYTLTSGLIILIVFAKKLIKLGD